MIFEMLRWWYVTGWLQTARRVITMTKSISRTFSMPLLVRTLIAPWRRIVSIPGRSFDARIRAALDNFVSRCIGLVVRALVLLVASIATIVTCIGGTILAIAWPLLPVLFVYLLIRSISA